VSKSTISDYSGFTQLNSIGYIHDSKQDAFGNTYGLIKDNNNFRRNVQMSTSGNGPQYNNIPVPIYKGDVAVFDILSSTSGYTTTPANIQSLTQRQQLTGTLFIRSTNGTISPLMSVFNFGALKYGSVAFNSLSSVISFDIARNTYFIQTRNFLIVDTINYDYETKLFNISNSTNNVYQYNSNTYNPITNRLQVQDYVYFATLSCIPDITLNNFLSAYIVLYKYDISKGYSTQYSVSTISPLVIPTSGVLYLEATTPLITYNSSLNRFNFSFVVKDYNKSPAIVSFDFIVTNTITIDKECIVPISNSSTTKTFNSTTLFNNVTALTASSTPTFNRFLLL
jgi:hypothetical protein